LALFSLVPDIKFGKGRDTKRLGKLVRVAITTDNMPHYKDKSVADSGPCHTHSGKEDMKDNTPNMDSDEGPIFPMVEAPFSLEII